MRSLSRESGILWGILVRYEGKESKWWLSVASLIVIRRALGDIVVARVEKGVLLCVLWMSWTSDRSIRRGRIALMCGGVVAVVRLVG